MIGGVGRGGGRVRARGRRRHPRRRADRRRSTSASRRPTAPSASALRAERADAVDDACAPRRWASSREVRPRPQRRARRRASARSTGSSPPATLRPYLIDAVERGMLRARRTVAADDASAGSPARRLTSRPATRGSASASAACRPALRIPRGGARTGGSGRWTAKAALGELARRPTRRGSRSSRRRRRARGVARRRAARPVSISLSHRAGRALAAVADAPAAVGCDLELLEPRSPAFVRDWLAPEEQARVTAGDPLPPTSRGRRRRRPPRSAARACGSTCASAIARLPDGTGGRRLAVRSRVDWTREGFADRRAGGAPSRAGCWRSAAAPHAPPPLALDQSSRSSSAR